jgi:thiamine-phosphate diphosphorylase
LSTVLHVISDRARSHTPLLDALVSAAKGGADILQIREKKLPAAELYHFCVDLTQRLEQEDVYPGVFINDRVDVAMATSSRGVHLASKSLPISVVKRLLSRHGVDLFIGCSVHSVEEAIEAAEGGADYVTFGHIYASESHPNLPPRGVNQLARVVEAVSIPVIAIGGIDATNVGPVLETGCSGVAVIGGVIGQANPERAAYNIKNQMQKCTVRPKVLFPTL